MENIQYGRDNLTPPFYINLELQNIHPHNFLYESRYSHSLMSLDIREKLRLDITRTYTYLYSFESKRVQFRNNQRQMVVILVQNQIKFVMMDAVIIDAHSNYGMLLSRH